MADIKSKYGTAGQTVTMTVASLANAAARQSAVIDNTTDLFLDAIVTASIKAGSSGVATTGYVNIYAYASVDGGTLYTGGASGSDAAYSGEKLNLQLVASAVLNANSMVATVTFDIAAAFGGAMPASWGLVVENVSGAALSATGGDHSIKYQGVLNQTV